MFGTSGVKGAYAKQKEIYERNGSPLGPYSGTLQQNTWLLNNKGKWKPSPAATPAPAPAPAAPARLINSLDQAKAKVVEMFRNKFGEVPTDDYVNSEAQLMANRGGGQDAINMLADYYNKYPDMYTKYKYSVANTPKIAPNPMPITFKWTDADIKRALAIAEKNIGPYFADLLKKTIEASNIGKERLTEDIAKNISDAEQKLEDYLQKSDTERTRVEEDFTRAKEETARSLGIDLETLELSRERGEEDKDRMLAEAYVDYETTGGRISDQKLKLLEDNSEYMASRGLTFSGNRVKGEMDIEKAAQQRLDDLNTNYERTTGGVARSYKRNLSDLNRQEKLRKEQAELAQKNLELSAGRSKEDLATQEGIVKRDTGSYIQGQELSQQRTLDDIRRKLEADQLAIERERAEQMRINPVWGVQTQEELESETYLDRFANADVVRTDPSRIQDFINKSSNPAVDSGASEIGQSLVSPSPIPTTGNPVSIMPIGEPLEEVEQNKVRIAI